METVDEKDKVLADLTEFFRHSMTVHKSQVSGIPKEFVVQVETQKFEANHIREEIPTRQPQTPSVPVLGIPQPGIDAIYPDFGTYLGGTTVTIVGRDFAVGMEVKIDGVSLIGINIISANTIYGVMPPHGEGTYDLTVGLPATTPFILTNAFTYTRIVITSIDPTHGSTDGGTDTHLYGRGFIEGAQVKWDNVNSIGGTFISSTQLTAVSPPHAEGLVDVSVFNPSGENGSLPDAFTYDPTITVEVSGPQFIQLQYTQYYGVTTTPNTFSGPLQLIVIDSLLSIHVLNAILWVGPANITPNPNIFNVVNGVGTLNVYATGGIFCNYSLGQFAVGYCRFKVVHPDDPNTMLADVTINFI